MLPALEQLLVLQDRDRKLTYLREELLSLAPQRAGLKDKAARAHATADEIRQKLRHIESERKKLELEAEAQKQLIDRYSLQQFQTRKNEEYRALTHEIEMCRSTIRKLEDEQLNFMEQAEGAQKEATAAIRAAETAKTETDTQTAALTAREENLRKELQRLESERSGLAEAVDPAILPRYERLRKSKGDKVIVGVDHGACGGCHVKLPAQILISAQASVELVQCPNCGRILYYTRDMSLVAAE